MKPRHFGAPQMTQRQAMTQLVIDLANMHDDRLFAATVVGLKPRYNLSARQIECVLSAKQAVRKRFLETGEIA